MVVRTCMSSVSEHGHKLSALKSGICKYFRRGEYEKFTWCVMEMAMFQKAEGNTKGILTNLVNRLKILLMEEIHCGEVGIILKAISLLDEFDENRDRLNLLLEYCELVTGARRTRSVSYLNNWWKNRYETVVYDESETDEKFRKKKDPVEMEIIAGNLLDFLKKRDEQMFGVFTRLYQMKEKAGRRYRRSDPVYVWWEMIEDIVNTSLPVLKPIFDFAIQMFFRKNMTERPAFGVWMGLMIWRYNRLDYSEKPSRVYSLKDVDDYYRDMKPLVLDEYVVKDYHVNKSYGLGSFAKNGAYVKDEDLSLLDEPQKYVDNYIQMKVEADEKKKTSPKKAKKSPVKKTSPKKTSVKKTSPKKAKKSPKKTSPKKAKKSSVETPPECMQIRYEDLSDIRVIEEGVCGGKVPCVIAVYDGEKYILKQMGKSMNYGADYMIIDKAKRLFGLRDMEMKRVTMNRRLDREDKKNRSYVGNWIFSENDSLYCMMKYFENVGDLGKNKSYLENNDVARESLKIRLFDGLFRSSDNILRNILVNNDGELLSIDEGDMFGKRELVFNKRGDYTKRITDKETVSEVIDSISEDIEEKIKVVWKLMDEYNLDCKVEFADRFRNYKEIVLSEW